MKQPIVLQLHRSDVGKLYCSLEMLLGKLKLDESKREKVTPKDEGMSFEQTNSKVLGFVLQSSSPTFQLSLLLAFASHASVLLGALVTHSRWIHRLCLSVLILTKGELSMS